MKKLKRPKFPIISKIKRKKNKALSNFTHFQKGKKQESVQLTLIQLKQQPILHELQLIKRKKPEHKWKQCIQCE